MKLRILISSKQTIPAVLASGMFLYLVFLIRPAIYAHHQQEGFLFAFDYIKPFLNRPGGPVHLLGKLFMQFLYRPVPGVFFLSLFLVLFWGLVYRYLGAFGKGQLLRVLSLVPGLLALILLNNYNFPFSVHMGMLLSLVAAGVVLHGSSAMAAFLPRFLLAAAVLYYLAGPGFSMVLALLLLPGVFLFPGSSRWKVMAVVLVSVVAVVLISREPLRFFPEEVYFKAYHPSPTFYAYLCTPAILSLLVLIQPGVGLRKPAFGIATGAAVFLAGLGAHLDCYHSDARKIAASGYYCYHADAEKTARSATSLKEYSFGANLNYNLAMGKTGQMSQRIFDFFQIRGTMSLQPDIDISSEHAFISADFYYEIGFMSEARHWAYEALVFYPHSPRALEMLVKVHIILEEYRAANRCLQILQKGMVNRKLIRTYGPMLENHRLIAENAEIMAKRKCIPAEKELNPYIHLRFRELLDANGANEKARQYLLVYYLMDGDLMAFSDLYEHEGNRSATHSPVYEEALLIHRIENDLSTDMVPAISEATFDRYRKFSELRRRYGNDKYQERNALYWEMGKTYFYYYYFLYPRIIKPVLNTQDSDEIAL